MSKSKEDVKRELREAREKAKKKAKAILTKTGGSSGGRHPSIKDISKDFSDEKTYYFVLLDLVPMAGAAHWFSADTDVKEDGSSYSLPRNCCANMQEDDSYGSNPDVCPACWLGQYEKEYYESHKELPELFIPVDTFRGQPNKAQLLIYYRAMVGEPKTVERVIEKADGTEEIKTTTRVDWWDDPVTLQVKPSVNTILMNKLEDIDTFGGDIRAFIWSFRKKASSGMDKYSDTMPLVHKNSVVDTPEWILEQRDELIAQLPKERELLEPTPVKDMAELLNIPNFEALKNGEVEEGAVSPDDKSDKDESEPSDEVNEDDLDLEGDFPF